MNVAKFETIVVRLNIDISLMQMSHTWMGITWKRMRYAMLCVQRPSGVFGCALASLIKWNANNIKP